jgi:hypothetical protein
MKKENKKAKSDIEQCREKIRLLLFCAVAEGFEK